MSCYLRSLCFFMTLFSFLSVDAQKATLSMETVKDLKLRSIGPATMSGRIVDLAVVEKDPYIIYVASATGGVWKTTNNGVTFKPVFENESTHSVGDIAVHQEFPHHLWVGTGERANRQSSSWGDGVYKSTDSGATWENVGLPESHHIGRIVLHPQDTNTVFVAAMGHLWGPNEERGLYKTTDGGASWQRILYVDENTGVVDVAMDPSDPDLLYAATYQRRRRAYGFHGGGPGSGLYKTTDGGANWTKLTEGLPEGELGRIGISIYRTDPNIVYASIEQGFRYNASTAYEERRAGLYRSEDKGATWTFMSNWNPRPMYASQPLVDPSDDQRIYMMNSFSYSDNGGKDFTTAKQSLHGDDRIVWVNPKDSRHVIKGDDGGLGISYDRAKTWLFVTSLPISQFYRVSVDMRNPYWVYGGLQDNGSWMGPSETYFNDGILNQDWIKTGGGDGFLSLVHRTDENTLFGESQYLGLFRMDLQTRQKRSIRPGDPKGKISPRRNWEAWGPGLPEPELGNAMAPANWDGPFYLSHHDPNTIYAGTNKLWKSIDNGNSWIELGDLTTKVNRRELKIMGQRADDLTASLDDGVPYYPTLTAIAESPLKQGLLYVGTDDGNLQVSQNDGRGWLNVTKDLDGLPESAWISGIETSKFEPGVAYVAINNYRNDDFGNYLYKTENYGQSWTSITGDLPANRVIRTVREDTRNPNLLFIGTEIGVFFSIDQGKHWVELKNNMPTLAFNDLVIHPRDNDLILGSHGRGIWILDHLNALQELTPEILASEANLFSIADATMIQYTRQGTHVGDMIFRGENPAKGVVMDYYLKEAMPKANVALTILTKSGKKIRELRPDTAAGINRVVWDFRYPRLPVLPAENKNANRWRSSGLQGPMVTPGLYMAKLTVNGKAYYQDFRVNPDPRFEVPIEDNKAWTMELVEMTRLYESVLSGARVLRPIQKEVEQLVKAKKGIDAKSVAEIKEVNRLFIELLSRTRSLYRAVSGWTGRLTADQENQLSYYQEMLTKLGPRKKNIVENIVPRLNKKLGKKDQIAIVE